jgi:hypothetical protein
VKYYNLQWIYYTLGATGTGLGDLYTFTAYNGGFERIISRKLFSKPEIKKTQYEAESTDA